MSRILIVTDFYYPAEHGGGGQVSVQNLVNSLTKNHEVFVFCWNHDYRSKEILCKKGHYQVGSINIFYLSTNTYLKNLLSIFKIKPDYIYFNSFFSPLTIFCLFIFSFLDAIKIISPKGEFYPGALASKSFKKMAWLSTFKCLHVKALKFHATSADESLIIKKFFPSFTVDLARDIPSFRKEVKNNKLKGRTTFKAVFISRIDLKKNLIFIPEILSGIKGPMEFDIWGEINDESYFKECVKEFSKLSSNIAWKYKGKLTFDQSSIKFQEYDLFIFPTKGENFGYVILESLQCGCPVLLSKDTTPWADLEENNVGYNIPLSDSALWIKRLSEYYKLDSTQRMDIRSYCINFVKSKVNLNEIEVENQNLFTR